VNVSTANLALSLTLKFTPQDNDRLIKRNRRSRLRIRRLEKQMCDLRDMIRRVLEDHEAEELEANEEDVRMEESHDESDSDIEEEDLPGEENEVGLPFEEQIPEGARSVGGASPTIR
jgi:Ran GTPase-activating protein (RanGAP) involved in mRNA processing and transport